MMEADSAAQLAEMMSNVVREGTGVGAALQGIQVAGKTGTAELNIAQRINQPWFIGFAPVLVAAGRGRGDARERAGRAESGRRDRRADREGRHAGAA